MTLIGLLLFASACFGEAGATEASDCTDGDVTACKNLCDNDNAAACNNLGAFHAMGKGVKQDYFKAVELFTKACEIADVCENLGQAYAMGKGVKQDFFKAFDYLTQGCDNDSSGSCYKLGWMYQDGKGVRQSHRNALKYFGKACDLRDQLGCDEYAKLKKSGVD